MRINPMVKKILKYRRAVCGSVGKYLLMRRLWQLYFLCHVFVFPADDLFVCKHIQQHCLAVSGTCGHADFYSGSGSPGAHGFCNFG